MVAVRGRDRLERLAAVARPPQTDVDDVDFVDAFGRRVDAGVIPGPLAEISIVADAGPRFAEVGGLVDVGTEIVEAMIVDGDIGRVCVIGRSFDDADEAPLRPRL